jgi:hypothetical protein
MPGMHYIQLVEFDSSHPAQEVRGALDKWLAATSGKRTLQTAIVAVAHARPSHYWERLEYPSEAEAKRASELPETKGAYDRWVALVDGEPAFHNLDVVEHVEGAVDQRP